MGTAALISIHPEHMDKILEGSKVFEYRRVLPKQEVTHLVLYCTAPVMKIMAIAEVLDRVTGELEQVWHETSEGGGISYEHFCHYFSGVDSAGAFALGKVCRLAEPVGLSSLPGLRTAPQSFCYLGEEDLQALSPNP